MALARSVDCLACWDPKRGSMATSTCSLHNRSSVCIVPLAWLLFCLTACLLDGGEMSERAHRGQLWGESLEPGLGRERAARVTCAAGGVVSEPCLYTFCNSLWGAAASA